MEKKRFIFDIDGTLLVPDWNYEEEYFSRVLSSSDVDIFLSGKIKFIKNTNIKIATNPIVIILFFVLSCIKSSS